MVGGQHPVFNILDTDQSIFHNINGCGQSTL